MRVGCLIKMLIGCCVGLCVIVLNVNDSYALTCNDKEKIREMNSSVYQACRQYRPGSPVGALWISSSKDAYNLSTTVDVNNQTSGQVTVYLHGAVIGSNENALATYIKFSSHNFSSSEWGNTADYGGLSVVNNRAIDRQANPSPEIYDIKSSVVELKLDIDKFVEIESNYRPEGESTRIYAVKLWGFRCYGSKTPQNNPSDCWANESDVTVRIPQASIMGKTGVTNGNKQSSTTLQSSDTEAELLFADNCENGCDFTFTHTLKKSVLGQGKISYKIKNSRNSINNVNEKSYNFNSNDMESHVVKEFTKKLYPGEKYCSEMTFAIGLGGKEATTRACAAAAGTLKTGVSVEAQVKRDDDKIVKKTNGGTIYAKPGDKKQFVVTYASDVQKAFNIKTEGMRYTDEEGKVSDLYSNKKGKVSDLYPNVTLGLFFNNKSPYVWNNSFSIFRRGKILTNQNGNPKVYKRFDVGTYSGKSVGPENDLWGMTWEDSFDFFSDGGQTITEKDVGAKEDTMKVKTNNKIGSNENYNKASNTVPSEVKFYSYDALKTVEKELVLESALDSNLVLTSGDNPKNGTNVQINGKKKDDALQKWKLLDAGDDYYYIVSNSNKNYVLDVTAANANNGANVQLYERNNSKAQQWKLERNGGGTYTVVSRLSSKDKKLVLDVSGASTDNGANVQIYQYNNTKSQKWNIGRSQYLVANVKVASKVSNEVGVAVPYNFAGNVVNLMESEDGSDDTKWDGVKFRIDDSVDYQISVGPRNNSKVGGNYATIVRGAEHGVEWCVANDGVVSGKNEGSVSDVCATNVISGGATSNGELRTETKKNQFNAKIFNSDEGRSLFNSLADGTTICVRAKVWPVSSGALDIKMDTSWEKGESNTAYSAWRCLPVEGKSYYLQVWGGNVYSDSGLNGNIVEKSFGSIALRFGSFGELGVISGGTVGGFASGAALGYAGVSNNGLTIPSYTMDGSESGTEFGGGRDIGKLVYQDVGKGAGVEDNMGQIVDLLENTSSKATEPCSGVDDFSNGAFNVNGASCGQIKDEPVYVWNGSRVSLGGDVDVVIPKGKTYVIRANGGRVTINRNIRYESYSSLSDIPRLIIYAKNIDIAPGIERIDGLLVATGSVNTCVRENGSEACDKQLMINGAVIANRLMRQRNYGAGEGVQSIVPAEIINFDPSLYDLTRGSTTSNTNNMKMVNTIELAPRY